MIRLNSRICVLIITGMLIVINSYFYIVSYIYEENIKVAYGTKWIPPFLLFLQTMYFYWHNTRNRCFKMMISIAYLLCMIGDIILISDKTILFMIGMFVFLLSYLMFGLGRVRYLDNFKDNLIKKLLGIIVMSIVQCLALVFIFNLLSNNTEFNNIYFKIAVVVYTSFINFAVSCNYVYLIKYTKWQSLASLVGLSIFALSDGALILYVLKYNTNKMLQTAVILLYWIGLIITSWSVYKRNIVYTPIAGF